MMDEKLKPEDVMSNYREAYALANGRAVSISYERGWFKIFSGGLRTSHRGEQVRYMTAELRNRVALAALKEQDA